MRASAHVLVVDDEPNILKILSSVLEDEGYRVSRAKSKEEAGAVLLEDPPDLLLLDVWLGEEDGLAFLEEIKRAPESPVVIVMSGHGTIETAVRALKIGAFDYIEKPFTLDKVLTVAANALRQRTLEQENRLLRERVEGHFEMVGRSPAMDQLRRMVERVGPTQGWVLISGENGTGKELVARQIHQISPRSRGPFVDVNCAAIPETLIESELFGHERGAYTGAHAMKKGKFELASGGTLFLDEIGDMALSTQAKVLRVLQERSLVRVGGVRPIPLDVRVIAASNRDLQEMISRKLFREDLFYRLNVVSISVPSLRDRAEDLPDLVDHFVRLLCQDSGHKGKEFSKEALDLMKRYSWPGNIRELRNLVERLLIMVPGPTIEAGDIIGLIHGNETDSPHMSGLTLKEARDQFERNYILDVLSSCDGNVVRAASRLGVDRTSLHRKIRQWEESGCSHPEKNDTGGGQS
jgi:two-component system nitrogen regulation response regulator NtrX